MEKLCKDREDAIKVLDTLDASANFDEYKAKLDEIKKIDNAIDLLSEREALEKETVKTEGIKTVEDKSKKFNSLGEQLRAIKDAATSKGKRVDPRLIKDEIKGVNTEEDADGGYAIQSDFIGNILDSAFKRSELVNRTRKYTVTRNSNRVNYVMLDDSADAESLSGVVVAGGVQAYWTSEGETVPPSKPKLKATELKLGKIMGLCYATEESLEDIPFMSQLIEDSFSDAVAGLLTDGILNGAGETDDYRQPIGLLSTKSNAVVEVEPASTKITANDFLAMKARMRAKNWGNAVWYMHPDVAEDLPLLNDGEGNLLYMPSGGISGSQYDTILGRPVVYDEFLPAKGEKGSILLADMNEYMIIRKGQERKDWSIHVEFLTDQQCFRIIMRVNGAPMRNNVWSVRNSTKKQGAFVALGAFSD